MTQQSIQQTTQQRRARSAWDVIIHLPHQVDREKYASLVKGLPMQIQRDGLGPTLAFLAAKGERHHQAVLDQLKNWVLPQLDPQFTGNLLDWALVRSSDDYRRAVSETQAYLAWLKRFVEAQDW